MVTNLQASVNTYVNEHQHFDANAYIRASCFAYSATTLRSYGRPVELEADGASLARGTGTSIALLVRKETVLAYGCVGAMLATD